MAHANTTPDWGGKSPWGTIEEIEPFAEGILFVHTPSHGGIWLSPERYAQMPDEWKSSDGWYEEDCESLFPLYHFRDEFNPAIPIKMDVVAEMVAKTRFSDVHMNRRHGVSHCEW